MARIQPEDLVHMAEQAGKIRDKKARTFCQRVVKLLQREAKINAKLHQKYKDMKREDQYNDLMGIS